MGELWDVNRRAFATSLVRVLSALLLTASTSGAQPGPRLAVKPLAIPPSAEIMFSASESVPIVEALPPDSDFDNLTTEGRFRFSVNTTQVGWYNRCSCYQYYVFYIQSTTTGRRFRSKVQARPKGAFPDHWEPVDLDLVLGDQVDHARVSLPLASLGQLDAIVQKADGIQDVHLNGVSPVSIQLTNTLSTSDIEVEVQNIDGDETLWKNALIYKGRDRLLRIRGGDTAVLRFDITPRPVEAAQRSFLRLQSDHEHVAIPFSLSYRNPAFIERSGRLNGTLRLRFRPTIPILLLAIPLGTILGSMLRLPRGASGRPLRVWMWTSLTALAAALSLWAAGLFFVGLGSQLILFTYNFDPWQTLPTFVIGLVCGVLGAESVDAVRRALKLDHP